MGITPGKNVASALTKPARHTCPRLLASALGVRLQALIRSTMPPHLRKMKAGFAWTLGLNQPRMRGWRTDADGMENPQRGAGRRGSKSLARWRTATAKSYPTTNA